MNLTPIFESAIPEMSRRETLSTLGDRGRYIGSSDLGCIRKSCLQRQYPIQYDVRSLLKFARGHAAEFILDKVFKASGVPYDTQVELTHPDLPLKCHIDFLFYLPDGLHVVEVKSVSGIPDAPYGHFEEQLQYQLGLLRIQYPHGKVSGSIVAYDVNAGLLQQYPGYEYDELTFNYLYSKALHLLDALNGQAEPTPSPSTLCGNYCAFREDCPAFDSKLVILPPDLEMIALKYADLNETKSAAEKEMKSIRQELIDFTGPSFKGRTEKLDLNVSYIEASTTIDGGLLKQLHPEVYLSAVKTRAAYSRLEVKKFKKKELKLAA